MIAAWTPPLARLTTPDAPLRTIGATTVPRVAYQGEPGAYGELAVRQRWADAATALGVATFAHAVALLRAGRVDAIVLPLRNTTIGPIHDAEAALAPHADELRVVGEIVVPVRHALIALPGATRDSIRAVGSHPAALAQCARFLGARPHVTTHEAFDTAGAARQLAALVGGAPRGLSTPWYAEVPNASPECLAAIASESAAERHGLVVLARDVQDRADNATHFVVVARR